MKITFDNEKERTQFSNWLKEVQGYVQEVEMAANNPGLFVKFVDNEVVDDEQRRTDHLKTNVRKLWYRIYDITDSMFEVKGS